MKLRSIETHCVNCNHNTRHRILKMGSLKDMLTVRCSECKFVHKVSLPPSEKEQKTVSIPLMISRDSITKKMMIEFPENEPVYLNNVYTIDKTKIKIRKIDLKEGIAECGMRNAESRGGLGGKAPVSGMGSRRSNLNQVVAKDIKTLWGIYYNEIPIKVSINLGRISKATKIFAKPERIFHVSDELLIDQHRYRITSIRTKKMTIKRRESEVRAEDVVRLYVESVKKS